MSPSKATAATAAAAAPPKCSSTPAAAVTPTNSPSIPAAAASAASAAAAPVSPLIPPTVPAIPSGGGNAKKIDAKCRSCARLVQEILQNPNSRPRQIIHSLIVGMTTAPGSTATATTRRDFEGPSFSLKPVEDGLQVQLRLLDKPYESPRRWTSVAPIIDDNSQTQQQRGSHSGFLPLPHLPPVMATSSSASSTSLSPSPDSDSQIPPTLEEEAERLQQQQEEPRYITETIKIECRPCDTVGAERGARALIIGPKPLSIVACTNRLTPNDRDEMSQVLVHELLHAYDVKRLKLDFSDCESMAYSEVRAAREAECHNGETSKFGVGGAVGRTIRGGLTEYCVKRLAIAAAQNLFPTQGRSCVGTVFATAYNDPRPFQDIQLQNYYNSQHQQQKQMSQQQQQTSPSSSSSSSSSSNSENINRNSSTLSPSSSSSSSLLAQQPTRRSTMHSIQHSSR